MPKAALVDMLWEAGHLAGKCGTRPGPVNVRGSYWTLRSGNQTCLINNEIVSNLIGCPLFNSLIIISKLAEE